MNAIRLGKFGIQTEKNTTKLQEQIDAFTVFVRLMGYSSRFITGYENGVFICYLVVFKDLSPSNTVVRGKITFVCESKNPRFYMVRFNDYQYDSVVELYDMDAVTEHFKKIHDWVE